MLSGTGEGHFPPVQCVNHFPTASHLVSHPTKTALYPLIYFHRDLAPTSVFVDLSRADGGGGDGGRPPHQAFPYSLGGGGGPVPTQPSRAALARAQRIAVFCFPKATKSSFRLRSAQIGMSEVSFELWGWGCRMENCHCFVSRTGNRKCEIEFSDFFKKTFTSSGTICGVLNPF